METPNNFKSIRLWDVTTWTELAPLSEDQGADLVRYKPIFFPDGTAALSLLPDDLERRRTNTPDTRVSQTPDGPLRIWETRSGKTLRTFGDASKGAVPRDIAPEGKMALVWHMDYRLELWDLTLGKPLRCFPTGSYSGGRFSPDGKRIFAYHHGADGSVAVEISDTTSGELRLSLAGADKWKYPLAFSSDDHLAVSERPPPAGQGEKTTLVLWDWTTGQEVRSFEPREGGEDDKPHYATTAAFTADGKAVVTLDIDRTLRRWSIANGKAIISVPLKWEDSVVSALTEGGNFAVTVGEVDRWHVGKRIQLWDTASGKVVRTISLWP
jgi:WD40 repeat protein